MSNVECGMWKGRRRTATLRTLRADFKDPKDFNDLNDTKDFKDLRDLKDLKEAGGGSAGMAEAEDFADPHYEGGCGDNYQPVKDVYRTDVEELASEFHDDYLANDDEHTYGDKSAAVAKMQC